MRIKIKRLSIRNFRCIGSLDLDFTDPDGNPLGLVVLAGPNGCGKTSVLEAIRVLHHFVAPRQYDPPGLFDLADTRAGAERYVLILTFDVEGQDVLVKLDSLGPSDWRALPGTSGRLDAMPFVYFTSWRAPKLVASLPVADEKRDKDEEHREADRLLALQKKCRDFWVHSSLNRHDPVSDPQVRALIDPLEKAWEVFYPGAEAEFIVRSVSKDNPEAGVNLYLRKKDGTEIPVNDLSSGEIEVLTMAGWFTMNDYRDGIVLIDEPELHMHEEWHCAMMRALRVLLPDTQIIVATHSAEILDSVMSYERFWLLHEGDPRLGPNDKPVIRDRPEQDA